jgi:polyhydroxyalkanoate synthesis repressor PhaR
MTKKQATGRIIKKYPNRRLYDTNTSAYITLADVKQLVLKGEAFRVQDAKSAEDLTRSILLQIILEEEAAGTPLFSEAVLAQMIRFYGNAMQGMMGAVLERQVQAFAEIQNKLAEQATQMPDFRNMGADAWSKLLQQSNPMQNMMSSYLQQSRDMAEKMQQQMFSAFGGKK